MNYKHEALWPLKNCNLYVVCTLILSNPFHLTIGSRLILIQSKIWNPKCCHENFKLFACVHNSQKIPSRFLFIMYYDTCYTSLLLVKSGWPLMCFHLAPHILPILFFKQQGIVLQLSWIDVSIQMSCYEWKKLINLNQQKADGTYFIIFCEFQII
jgi:hypothetical protein